MYIPMDWFRNAENEKEVRALISEYGGCLRFEGDLEKVESRLEELGEDRILEELKKGTFAA